MTGPKTARAVTLLWGEDPYLLREAALDVLGDVRATEVDGAEWQGRELQDLATPSLFGERRALLVSDARALPKDALSELAAYLAAPDPDALLVIVAVVGERGKVPAALEKVIAPAGAVRRIALARKELEPWLVEQAHRRGMDLGVPAARALVETLGPDPAPLVGALEQLADAFVGAKITPALVAQQFRGLGEQKAWDLCDRAFGLDLPGAIRSLRSIEEGGDDPLKTLGAVAARLRDLIGVRSLPERTPPAEVARIVGTAVRLAGAAVSAAVAELHLGPARGPARPHHRSRPSAQERRERRRRDAHARRSDRLGTLNDQIRGPREAALLPGGGALVHDALGGGLVEGASCLAGAFLRRLCVALGHRDARLLRGGLQRRAHGFVALAARLVLLVPFDL